VRERERERERERALAFLAVFSFFSSCQIIS
jgi:hypothetical protein